MMSIAILVLKYCKHIWSLAKYAGFIQCLASPEITTWRLSDQRMGMLQPERLSARANVQKFQVAFSNPVHGVFIYVLTL